jgi:thymidylate synthase
VYKIKKKPMKLYKEKDFSSLYKASLSDLMLFPEHETRPRDLKIRENINTVLVLEDPLSCLYSNPVRSSQKKYISAELLWYFAGRNDVGFIKKYAKFWESIQNPDGTVNSAYGNLLFSKVSPHGFTQYDWAISCLIKDKDSRQAVMHFNLPEHQYSSNRDFVCTMYAIFQIRNDKLSLTVSMRSNDVILGLPTDIAFFATLQGQALVHLRQIYPDLELGTYTHIANSFHIYEHHFDLASRMLAQDFTAESIPPVTVDLVTKMGKTTPIFDRLFAHHAVETFEDPLCNWIATNIK